MLHEVLEPGKDGSNGNDVMYSEYDYRSTLEFSCLETMTLSMTYDL